MRYSAGDSLGVFLDKTLSQLFWAVLTNVTYLTQTKLLKLNGNIGIITRGHLLLETNVVIT